MDEAELKQAKILIVDDEPANVLVLGRMLERAGYTDLTSTTDSSQVVALCAERPPDLILLDLHMPDPDGFEVMRLIRPWVEGLWFPILVLTADITAEAKEKALSSGAKDFVTKPFDRTEVLLRIKNLLEIRFLQERERRHAENALRESEEWSRRIVETAHEGIWTLDADDKTTFVNARMAKMLGYSVEEMTGRSLSDFVDGDDQAESGARQEQLELAAAGQELRFRRKDGTDFRALLSTNRLTDDKGRHIGALLMVTDGSERERARQESDRLKGEFLGTISHELRTPLTSIKGYLQLLLEGHSGESSDDGGRFLHVIERNTSRLEHIVEDLLLVAQLEAGRPFLKTTVFELDQLAAERVEAARSRAQERHIDLSFEAKPLANCDGDRDRLGLLLDNLISNALKFTPEGGRVEVRLNAQNGHVLVEVQDSGIGIAPTEQAHIFEPFFRAPVATEQAIQGVGLGLTIAKAIAEAHGGQVGVEGGEGMGTTFRVAFPLQRFPVNEGGGSRATGGGT